MAFYDNEVKPKSDLLYLIKGQDLFDFRLKNISLCLPKRWTIYIEFLYSRLGAVVQGSFLMATPSSLFSLN